MLKNRQLKNVVCASVMGFAVLMSSQARAGQAAISVGLAHTNGQGSVVQFVVDADPSTTDQPSGGLINFDATLLPGDYVLGIIGLANSEIGQAGTAGYTAYLNLDFALGSGFSIPGGFSLSTSELQVVGRAFGQPDDSKIITSDALPYDENLAAQAATGGHLSTAIGNHTAVISGQTLQFDSAIKVESAAPPGGPVLDGASGYFRTEIRFTLTDPTAVTLVGEIAVAGRGDSQDYPQLPPEAPDSNTGRVVLWNVHSGFCDPPLASGYDFAMISGSLFTEIINFPTGIDGDGEFHVWVGALDLGAFSVGESVDFVDLLGAGVESFTITGIDPSVDGGDPLAFPINLAFNTEFADFTMTPIAQAAPSAPEPTTLVLLSAASTLLLRRRKH